MAVLWTTCIKFAPGAHTPSSAPRVLQLMASGEEMLRRVRILAAAEGGTAMSEAGKVGKKAGAAAGAAASASRSHNNERDFGRRLEAYRAIQQEDAADLAARVSPHSALCSTA